MTKFANKTFSSPANNQAYRDNFDRVFSEQKPRLVDGPCQVCVELQRNGIDVPCSICTEVK